MFKTPILMLKMKFFWLIFRGKFEQKTQKSIFLKNQWRLKNIKKAMVVKNIIAEDMPFTKSIFEQFWRSYCKKTIFVVFHFLKFLPICVDFMKINSWMKRSATRLALKLELVEINPCAVSCEVLQIKQVFSLSFISDCNCISLDLAPLFVCTHRL